MQEVRRLAMRLATKRGSSVHLEWEEKNMLTRRLLVGKLAGLMTARPTLSRERSLEIQPFIGRSMSVIGASRSENAGPESGSVATCQRSTSDDLLQTAVQVAATVSVPQLKFPSDLMAFRSAGHFSAGDGGGALYKKVSSRPDHSGFVQSADGAWWEISENTPNVRQFGAVGDGVTDDTNAVQNASDYCTLTSKTLFIPTPNKFYLISSTVNIRFHSFVGDMPLTPTSGAAQFQTSANIPAFWIRGSRLRVENIGILFNQGDDHIDEAAVGFLFGDTKSQFSRSSCKNLFVRFAYDSFKTNSSGSGTIWSCKFEQCHSDFHRRYAFNFEAAHGSTTLYLNNCYGIGNTKNGNKPKGFYLKNIYHVTGGQIYVDFAHNEAICVINCATFTVQMVALEACVIEAAYAAMIQSTSSNLWIDQIDVNSLTFDAGEGNRAGLILAPKGDHATRVGTVHVKFTRLRSGNFYKFIATEIDVAGALRIDDPGVRKSEIFANGYDVLIRRSGRHSAPSVDFLTGTWEAGAFVWNDGINTDQFLRGKYIVLGWSRLTSGSKNKINTDWMEVRIPAGE